MPLLLPVLRFPTLTRPLFSFTAPSPTLIYTLSLHDALPISRSFGLGHFGGCRSRWFLGLFVVECCTGKNLHGRRSEEHTSELQSRGHLVCRLLLEKKNEHMGPRHSCYRTLLCGRRARGCVRA